MLKKGEKSRVALMLACLMLAGTVFILAKTGIWLTREAGRVAALWLANAAVLAALLRTARAQWLPLMLSAMAANIAANIMSGDPAMRATALSTCNVVEILIAAHLVAARMDRRASFDNSATINIFLVAAGLVAPISSALLAAAYLSFMEGASFAAVFLNWSISDSLGLLTLTPLLLSIDPPAPEFGMLRPTSASIASRLRSLVQSFLFLAAMTLLVLFTFYQSVAPLLFLTAPILVFSALRLSLGGSMLLLMTGALIATGMTIAGFGPIHEMVTDSVWRIFVLQAYIAVMIFLVLPVRGVVSERDKLGAAYAFSERKFAGIAEASPAGILHLDEWGEVTWANQMWQRLTGLDPIALADEDWLQIVHPADALRAQTLWASVRAHSRIARDQFRKAPQCGNGWFELAFHPQFDGELCVGFVARLSDVSDRKAAEEKLQESEKLYRLVTENSRDMIFRIGLDGIAIYVSSASKRVLGVDPSELIGRPLNNHIHPDEWQPFAQIFSDLLVGSGAPEWRFRMRMKDGDYLWVEGHFQLIVGQLGEPIELVATIRDVQRTQNIAVIDARLGDNPRSISA